MHLPLRTWKLKGEDNAAIRRGNHAHILEVGLQNVNLATACRPSSLVADAQRPSPQATQLQMNKTAILTHPLVLPTVRYDLATALLMLYFQSDVNELVFLPTNEFAPTRAI